MAFAGGRGEAWQFGNAHCSHTGGVLAISAGQSGSHCEPQALHDLKKALSHKLDAFGSVTIVAPPAGRALLPCSLWLGEECWAAGGTEKAAQRLAPCLAPGPPPGSQVRPQEPEQGQPVPPREVRKWGAVGSRADCLTFRSPRPVSAHRALIQPNKLVKMCFYVLLLCISLYITLQHALL